MSPPGDLKTYLFEYTCDGVKYGLDVPAYSQQEAVSRVRRMSTAVYLGTLVATIPVPYLGWWERLVRLFRGA